MTDGISLVCFASSYCVGILLDLTRGVTRVSVLRWGSTAIVALGWLAHTIYLGARMSEAWWIRGDLFANWGNWCLIIAWCLVGCDLSLKLRRPATSWGIFLLPIALAFVIAAWRMPGDEEFASPRAYGLLTVLHGWLLLGAAISVSIGFAGGVMYLMQARRLKLKVAASRWPQLPSLEWLWRWNERMLVVSVVSLLAGLGAGLAMNVATPQRESHPIPWNEPMVWSSLLMMCWLVAVATFHGVYPPARLGNKVAYLVVASFCLFAVLLWIVFRFPADHTRPREVLRVGRGAGPVDGANREAWGGWG